jgi:hypothetical protein
MHAAPARAMRKWPPGGSLIDEVNFQIETEFQFGTVLLREKDENKSGSGWTKET